MPRSEPAYLGEFEYLVLLAAARLGTDAYALAIARELESQAGRESKRSALYTTLDRLEHKGLVRWQIAAGSAARERLPRRIYSLTAKGVASVRATRRAMSQMEVGLDDLLRSKS